MKVCSLWSQKPEMSVGAALYFLFGWGGGKAKWKHCHSWYWKEDNHEWDVNFKLDLHDWWRDFAQSQYLTSASSTRCNEGTRWGIREGKVDRWQFVKSWININYISSVHRGKRGYIPGCGSPLRWWARWGTARKLLASLEWDPSAKVEKCPFVGSHLDYLQQYS